MGSIRMDFCPTVVVHFKSGEIRKGRTRNFAFFRETFDLVEVDAETNENLETLAVRVEDLKAVFFVKDFGGNPSYRTDRKAEREGFGNRVEITFQDNETLIGYTPRYKEDNNGFILYPADSNTNNELVAVVRSAIQSVKTEPKHTYFYK
jgi:hypothetical protein